MKGNLSEKLLMNLDGKYIDEAMNYNNKMKKTPYKVKRYIGRIAACLAIVFAISVSTVSIATAAGNIKAYDLLYSANSKLAEKLSPVNRSCEYDGIKMEVEAIYVHEDTADIYISMQDLIGDRIDETTDLFDSYSIHTNVDQSGGCSLINYDEESKTATFLINVKQNNGKIIIGKKMIFSVSKILSGKKETNEELSDIRLENVPVAAVTQSDVDIRGRGFTEGNSLLADGDFNFLVPDEANNISQVEGVKITSYGFVENKLHIQAYYDEISKYDNHGSVYIKKSDGTIVECIDSISFWDENKSGSYEEYVFDIGPKDNLDDYSVWGDFVTCNTLINGDWKVTFPIENYSDAK